MFARLTAIALGMIGLVGVLFTVSGASLLLGLPMALIGFVASFSLISRK